MAEQALRCLELMQFRHKETLTEVIRQGQKETEQKEWLTAALRHEGIATEFRMRGGTSDVQGVVFARNGYPFNGSKIDRQFSFSKIDHALSLNRRQALSANERGSVSNPVASFSHLLEDLLQPVYDADEERRLQERLRKKRKQHRL